MADKPKKPSHLKLAEPAPNKICIEKEHRELPVKLSKKELEDFGKRIAEATRQKEAAEGRKAIAMRNFRQEIGGLEDEIRNLAQSMGAEAQPRQVECRWKYDLAHSEKTLTRTDTKEVVEKKTLRVDEIAELRQPGLPLKGGKTGSAKAAETDAEAKVGEAPSEEPCKGCVKLTPVAELAERTDGFCRKCGKKEDGASGKKPPEGTK